MVSYNFNRLCFKKAIIEKLEASEQFNINTPSGVFTFTRTQFEETFPKVIQTASWLINGVYHFPTTPKRALPFFVAK